MPTSSETRIDMDAKYPFEMLEIVLASITVVRTNDLAGKVELPVEAEVKIAEAEFPNLQINLRLKSPKDQKLFFDIEYIGLFKYIGEKTEFDKGANEEFVFEKGTYMLWVAARQTIKTVTSQMGMNPLNIRIPASMSRRMEQMGPEKDDAP